MNTNNIEENHSTFFYFLKNLRLFKNYIWGKPRYKISYDYLIYVIKKTLFL